VEFLVVDTFWKREVSFLLQARRTVIFNHHLFYVLNKIVFVFLQCSTQFYCDLLLLLENDLVVGHVLLGVNLLVGFELVEVQTVLVGALLVLQEKLAEL